MVFLIGRVEGEYLMLLAHLQEITTGDK